MAKPATVRDLLADHAEKMFVGRSAELAFLSKALEISLPPVSFVHGIAGIGKSRLLEAFTRQARAQQCFVVWLDCRQFEPTPAGFLRELGSAVGADAAAVGEASERLGQILQRVILVLDNYEVLRLLDTWLRQEFVPALPNNVHMIICGREAPLAAWLCTSGWGGLFRSLAIEPLSEPESIKLLALSGISEESRAHHINRYTRGHPLALTLAAATLAEGDAARLEDLALHQVIAELARIYLAEIHDEITRRALEATSVVRCTTVSLLRAMLPEAAPQDLYERLHGIPFVRLQRDGLRIHDSLQQAIVLGLKAADPTRYFKYRRAAWYQLRSEVRTAPPADVWRYTADMLYLIENPVVREAFFPTDAMVYAVEPARTEDCKAILGIAAQCDGPEAQRCLEQWWRLVPQSFVVVKDAERNVIGFYCMIDSGQVPPELASADPVLANWLEHLQVAPVNPVQTVLLFRRWLSRGAGEAPCGIQAACWLDIKASYMRLRPQLRRVYATVRDELGTYAPILGQLGFQVIPGAETMLDGKPWYTAMLDFGPSSVDGWLGRVVARELGVNDDELLDPEARELVINGHRVPLTPLEFSLTLYLQEHEGAAVSREALLRDVWGHKYDVGSNVVDVVVRSVRKKLGDHAGLIETVPGFGYRLRHLPRTSPP